MSLQASLLNWRPPAAHELLRWPLPYQKLANRYLLRGLALVARGRVLAVSGLQHDKLRPFSRGAIGPNIRSVATRQVQPQTAG
jgi:hypothetical protein